MSNQAERCPACNGLTYRVGTAGAEVCTECKGTGTKLGRLERARLDAAAVIEAPGFWMDGAEQARQLQ